MGGGGGFSRAANCNIPQKALLADSRPVVLDVQPLAAAVLPVPAPLRPAVPVVVIAPPGLDELPWPFVPSLVPSLITVPAAVTPRIGHVTSVAIALGWWSPH